MKRFKLTRIGWFAVALCAVALCACGGGDDETAPAPTPQGPDSGRLVYNTRWNPNQSFQSSVLGKQVAYSVLVPQEYLSNTGARFPVVYLFHGYGDSPDAWGPGHFDIQQQDALARAAGQTGPVIYVIPQGWNSYFVNRYDGGFNYMDMIVNELVPLVDRLLPTQADARGRAVAGYSMGGFGALAMAGKNPDLFGTCISLSPSMNTDEQYCTIGGWDSQWGDVFGGRGSIGTARLTPHYLSLCPLHFFEDNLPSAFTSQTWFVDCGDKEERLYAGSGELHSLLRDKGIPHEFRVRNGAHNTSYWREGLREGLAVFKAANEGAPYDAATPVKPASGAAPSVRPVDGAPCPVTLFVGNGCKSNDNTQVIYAEIGSGASAIESSELAKLLSQALQIKNVALAVVKSADAASADADAVFRAVESSLGLSIADSGRAVLALGNGLKLFGPLAGSGRSIAGFYLYDSDLVLVDGAALRAAQYMLDITDMGKNHRNMFNAFCRLRDAGAKVEYRVHNGVDDAACAAYGVANLAQVLFDNLPIR